VILRSCGPSLQSLRLGFQVIGDTDDDTPRTSIPLALSHISSSLTHLALRAPNKGSSNTTGLLDDCIAVLPHLEILEWSEQFDLLPIPLASSKLLTKLPKGLKVLRGRGIVSVTTSKLLSMLDDAESIPVLEEIDLVWAEEEKEQCYKERHRGRIEEACEDLGIRCRIAKGNETLVFKRAQV
jgi:hypothetical protein